MEPAAFRLPADVDGAHLVATVGGSWDGSVLARSGAALSLRITEGRVLLGRLWRWPWRWSSDDALEHDVVRGLVAIGAAPINDVARAKVDEARA